MVFLDRLRQPVFWIVLFFALAMGAVSLGYTYTKYRALGFNPVDYSFYVESVAKISSPDRIQQLNINPDGHNVLRFDGTEGFRSIHQTIHFEPIKYIEALIFRFSGSPVSLFLFVLLVSTLPVLYLLEVAPQNTKRERLVVLLVALLYLLQPLFVLLVADDLRPRVFLESFFLLAFFALYYRRPVVERVLFFNLLFFAREEALILGAGLLLFDVGRSYNKPSIARPTLMQLGHNTLPLGLSWVLWAFLTLLYYRWTGYPFMFAKTLALHGGVVFAVLVFCLATLVFAFLWREKILPYIEYVSLGALFVATSVQCIFSTGISAWREPLTALNMPYMWLSWTMLFCVIFLYVNVRIHSFRGIVPLTAIFLCVFVYAAGWFWGPASVFNTWSHYASEARSAEPVWGVERTLPKNASLFVDLSVLQAFYRFDNAYAFQQLPVFVAGADNRFYPQNQRALTQLMQTKTQFIFVTKQNAPIMKALALGAHKRLQPLIDTDEYILWAVKSSDTAI